MQSRKPINDRPETPAPRASSTTATAFATPTSRPTPRVGQQQVTHEQIARRAYEISKSGTGGTPEDNWFRAERELRARA